MSTKKNRFHRTCANVQDHLNYTKFSYFALRQVVDREVHQGVGIIGDEVLAQIFRWAFTGPCGKIRNFIVMFPLDCE